MLVSVATYEDGVTEQLVSTEAWISKLEEMPLSTLPEAL